MPRQARRLSESGIYHIMLRGINRQQIFEDEEDYNKFISVLEDCKAVSGFDLYAYCLMGNHIHLLMKPNKEPLELIFKRIGSRYVYWYNWKYNRIGHLFQDRFKSEPIDSNEYFLTVLRYIHFNPVKAGLSLDIFSYNYSSCDAYRLGNSNFVDTKFVFDLLPKDELLEFFSQQNDDFCMDISPSNMRLSDTDALLIIKELSGTKNPLEIQLLDIPKRNDILAKLREHGLSIRQISRLTGISFNIVRKF